MSNQAELRRLLANQAGDHYCHTCGAETNHTVIRQPHTPAERITITDMPMMRCDQCQAVTYDVFLATCIEELTEEAGWPAGEYTIEDVLRGG